MIQFYNRNSLIQQLAVTYSDPARLQENINDPEMPKPLVDWLTQLALLHGVPFNYLVPDEGMLPPESIRFFYLDANWVAALCDGAMSIGRNLSGISETPAMNLQRAVQPTVQNQVLTNKPQVRAAAFGLTAADSAPAPNKVISGFVLRSSLVLDYPSMGVNVYPEGHTPDQPDPKMLNILRFEQLGPTSDTLICLVDGDAYRVDIHEAPQALHYGIDKVGTNGGNVTALKMLYTFGNNTVVKDGITTNSVTMSNDVHETDISNAFRPGSRVIGMAKLANLILQANKKYPPPPGTTAPDSIDSAEMGFEMTEGVGMVSFYRNN